MSYDSTTDYQDISPEEMRELMDEIESREKMPGWDEIVANDPPIDIDEVALDLEEIGRWLATVRPFSK